LAALGADAVLVGETLVRAKDVGAKVRQLVGTDTPLEASPAASNKTRIKICGLTNQDDALYAAQAGADLLGFVFYPKSSRCVVPEQVRPITQMIRQAFGAAAPCFVGVFVNEPVDRVQAVLDSADLDLAQLHGSESPDEVGRLRRRAFKAIGPRTSDAAKAAVSAYNYTFPSDPASPQLLLDAYAPNQYGGSGTQADWGAARWAARHCRLLLAGGLTAENVGAAIAAVRPWGVDVSSGVERAKGLKDSAKIQAFIDSVRGIQ
jgi:phosphoribosylanthranilate isomerase